MTKYILAALLSLAGMQAAVAQSARYTTANAHAHNDYEHNVPFYTAYYKHFGSIEADVFARNGQLYVAHEEKEIDSARTLARLYLQPLQAMIRKYNGDIFDNGRPLQLLIDFKTDSVQTMQALLQLLQQFPDITRCPHIQLVISGSQPVPAQWDRYPGYILFDGKKNGAYTAAQQQRIPLFSYNFKDYTKWNGKGMIVAPERERLQALIDSVHHMGKKIRFWGAPDNVNTWITLSNMGVDYLGTDNPEGLAAFLDSRPTAEYRAPGPHAVYPARYVNNDRLSKVKNVILLIGDGMGLAQIHAGYTANRGKLNLLQMINIGFSKTASADSYITDSAAGATAMATGQKTNNRYIGVDATGVKHPAIPDLIQRYGMESALISAGDITDATPAAFYGHQPERSMQDAIARDLLQSPVSILVGGGMRHFELRNDSLPARLQQKGYVIRRRFADLDNMHTRKWLLLDDSAVAPVLKGRGDFLSRVLQKTIQVLQDNQHGFFIMAEGAQIDAGGHANNVPYAVTEMLDFDKAVGAAMQFADTNGETLVIVTADHETGGLSLLDGNIRKGYVNGHFSTDDHTAVMVPVFAYGPHSLDFRGVYENTEIFEKIMSILSERK